MNWLKSPRNPSASERKGATNSLDMVLLNLAISLENNETLAAKGILGGNSWLTWLNKLSNFDVEPAAI